MAKLTLLAFFAVGLAACSHQGQGRPVLKDSHGWPYPTWASMEGLHCYDRDTRLYVDARKIDHDFDHDYVCGYGWQYRGTYYDPGTQYTRDAQRRTTQTPPSTRPPAASYPDGAGPSVMR